MREGRLRILRAANGRQSFADWFKTLEDRAALIGPRRIVGVQAMSRVAEATGISREISEGVVLYYNASGATLPPACYPQRCVSRNRCPSGGQAITNHAAWNTARRTAAGNSTL